MQLTSVYANENRRKLLVLLRHWARKYDSNKVAIRLSYRFTSDFRGLVDSGSFDITKLLDLPPPTESHLDGWVTYVDTITEMD
jgi:hypothetical protein